MKRSANANPVIISVYVESPSPSPSQKPNHPTTKIKPDSFSKNPRIPRTDGYDRRAQLLAYARAMRTSGGSPPAAQRTERKKSRWSAQAGPKRIRICLDQILRRRNKSRRYERLGSDEEEEVEERSATPERAYQRSKTPFYRKFSRMLRKLSCGWKCAKGSS
ncbi:uncharacterized protein LOC115663094 [Syzygium oleosum]|uniref:uncharacterized protein LOC115663094 n=1 Tax=Syzygium oleosum TaxID=219896 RepID=UPI0011D18FC4|nr:uncharacterized protein LOC115663094 [Syzygium oleosum]